MSEDGPCELDRLNLVELTLLEEDAKVLEDRRERSGLDGDALELLDRLRRSEDTPGRVGSDLGGLGELARLEELIVLRDVEVVRSRKVGARGELDGEIGVVESA